jgi:hypothetical protein
MTPPAKTKKVRIKPIIGLSAPDETCPKYRAITNICDPAETANVLYINHLSSDFAKTFDNMLWGKSPDGWRAAYLELCS